MLKCLTFVTVLMNTPQPSRHILKASIRLPSSLSIVKPSTTPIRNVRLELPLERISKS